MNPNVKILLSYGHLSNTYWLILMIWYDQKKILFKFALLYLNFLEYKGVNEKLLLSLSFVLSETELSAILDLSDLSELSAKHELAISKSMLINRFILVILRSPKCNWLISGGELVFYIYISQWEIKVTHHSGDCFDLESDS